MGKKHLVSRGVRAALLMGLGLFLILTAWSAPASRAAQVGQGSMGLSSTLWTFSGHVYEGAVGNTSHPLAEVEVALYGANGSDIQGELVDRTMTDSSGSYALISSVTWEFYNIMQWNNPGYTSVGAQSPRTGGIVRNSDWVQYPWPLSGRNLSGNNFWDVAPAPPTSVATATDTNTPIPPTATRTRTKTPTRTRTPSATTTASTRTPTPGTATPTPTPRMTPEDTLTPSPIATLPPNCSERLVNGGFEGGTLAPWGSMGTVALGAGHAGAGAAWLGGGASTESEIWQDVTIPASATPVRLEYWWLARSAADSPQDALTVLVQYGNQADQVRVWRAVAPFSQWQQDILDLSAYAGHSVAITFHSHIEPSTRSTFAVDDVSLLACGGIGPTPSATATALPGQPWVVNTTADHDDGSCDPLSEGDCTLREAIRLANERSGPGTILFDIPIDDPGYEGGRWTIAPESELPELQADGLTIDALTVPGELAGLAHRCSENKRIILEGARTEASGLTLRGANQKVLGMLLRQWTSAGIRIDGARAHDNVVACNDILDNDTGVAMLNGAHGNLVGGPLGGNMIAGGSYGIAIGGSGSDHNRVLGNLIGTDAGGMTLRANSLCDVSICCYAAENEIGGASFGEGNVIGGSTYTLWMEGYTHDNHVRGNQVGVAADGASVLSATGLMVYIDSSSDFNDIGGAVSGEGNVMRGGLLISGSHNHITGNWIGTDRSGTAKLGSMSYGIRIQGAENWTTHNVIANNDDGIVISGANAYHCLISQNAIYHNSHKGIELENGGNNALAAPLITSVTLNTVAGTCLPGSSVEVFSDQGDEGQFYHGVTTADANGQWSFSGTFTGKNVNAVQIDTGDNASEFSTTGWAFSGTVELHTDPPRARPIPAEVRLYGAKGEGEPGTLLASAPTGPDGSYELRYRGDEGDEADYVILTLVMIDPAYLVRTAISHSGGEATSDGRIRFHDVPKGSYNGNDFALDNTPLDLDAKVVPWRLPVIVGPYLPITPQDFIIEGIEVTQAIQCYQTSMLPSIACKQDNEVPLVAGKLTIVRVYATVNKQCATQTSVATVRVDLHMSSSAGSQTCSTSYAVVCADPKKRRESVLGSANFYLTLPAAGTVQFWAEVDADHAWPDPDYTNNRYPSSGTTPVGFGTRQGLNVGYYLVDYHPQDSKGWPKFAGNSLPSATWTASSQAWGMYKALYPSAALGYYSLGTLTYTGPDIRDDYCVSLFSELTKKYVALKALCGAQKPDRIFGWVPDGSCNGVFYGWSADNNKVAVGRDGSRRIVAHELAHTLTLRHAACPADSLMGVDPKWPYPNQEIVECGFDVSAGKALAGATWDWMAVGTCRTEDSWISPYHWSKLYWALEPGCPLAPGPGEGGETKAQSPAQVALVSGALGQDGTGTLDPIYSAPVAEPPSVPVSGTYSLAWYGGTGALLGQSPFEPQWYDADLGSERERITFDEAVPFPEGARRLALWHGSTLLAERRASAHAPDVSLGQPAGGETWEGRHLVTWDASDADDDALTFTLLYSADNGETWLPVVMGITQTQAYLDTTTLPGGEQARVRVLATDGFNTTACTSEPFSVPGKAPQVAIATPETGLLLTPDEALLLEGLAHDPEDGALEAQALSWWSDRDGLLGRGETLVVPGGTLRRGWHTITLRADDQSGMTGKATVQILVGQRLYMPIAERR